jgi:hypothetical protein
MRARRCTTGSDRSSLLVQLDPFRDLPHAPGVPRATLLVLIYALVYSGFCFLLDAGGHRPSFGALVERHYLLLAVLLLPAAFVIWLLHSATAQAMARALGGGGTLRDTMVAIGPAYALPMLLLFVLPDLITYLAFGFDALGKVVRVFAPLALLCRIVVGTRAVMASHSISPGRALLAELIALLAEGAATVPWLR